MDGLAAVEGGRKEAGSVAVAAAAWNLVAGWLVCKMMISIKNPDLTQVQLLPRCNIIGDRR